MLLESFTTKIYSGRFTVSGGIFLPVHLLLLLVRLKFRTFRTFYILNLLWIFVFCREKSDIVAEREKFAKENVPVNVWWGKWIFVEVEEVRKTEVEKLFLMNEHCLCSCDCGKICDLKSKCLSNILLKGECVANHIVHLE